MVRCVLCGQRDETPITGPLSTKDGVTAHQNCLLYASGIWILQDSPEFDDLFGFSAKDVLKEAKRGKKLTCNDCKKKGATAGCEVKTCRKSYHYPCAIQAGAKLVEDQENEKYSLYCSSHLQYSDANSRPVNGHASSSTKSSTSKDPSGAGPSKAYCLTCERAEGNISLDNMSSVILLYCDKHAPLSYKRTDSVDSATAGPSGYSSDSNSSSSMKRRTSKRRLSFTDDELEKNPPKRIAVELKGIITDDSSDSGWSSFHINEATLQPSECECMLVYVLSSTVGNECDASMSMFAPIESETEAGANSQLSGKDSESPASLTSGNQAHSVPNHGNGNEDDTDAGSSRLLSPVRNRAESPPAASTAHPEVILNTNSEVSGPEQSTVPDPETGPSGLHRSSSPSDPEPSIDAASFWKNCNAAGCTQAVFTDFIHDMNDLCGRIQSHRASKEEYDLALTVMKASGKLAGLVIKQQKELQRKQMELQKATAALQEVISALK